MATSLGVAISAQDPEAKPEVEAEPVATVGRTNLDVHTESTSRELFSACDRDSDDRLDLFEACDALETLGDPKDSTSFLPLDRNRDGYLQWPEFDEHYRSSIERGGTFRVRTCRRFVRQLPELQEARTAAPLEIFLQLNDTNKNGGLDPDEIQKIVRDMGLSPVFESQLERLDIDQSGLVEKLELAPWFEQIRAVVTLPGVSSPPTPSGMPPPWGDIDGNGDSAIDIEELSQALRRLDPGLARWAAAVMKKLDRDGDGKLAGQELPGAQPAGTRTGEADAGATSAGARTKPAPAADLLGALRGRSN